MKHLFVPITIVFLLASAPVAQAADTAPAPVLTHTLGSADAPVTVNEYVSFTCPHCAEFYNDILPDLKTKYVDTGKVKFILHSFVLNGVDLKASSLASCMPEDEYYPFISVLYKNQMSWALAPDPDKILIQYAMLGGLDADKAKACLTDTKIQEALAADVKQTQDKLGINSTPTFIIDPGANKIEGAKPVQEYAALFDRLLAIKK